MSVPRGRRGHNRVIELEWFAAAAVPLHDPPHEPGKALRMLVVDTETTGLDADQDQVIELAALGLVIDDASGLAIDTWGGPARWFQDPKRPIPAEIVSLTGITDSMVQGQAIDEPAFRKLCDGADMLVAHNARFDRLMLARRFPWVQDRFWACSLDGIRWREHGAPAQALESLLWFTGFYVEGSHRALEDVVTLAHVLGQPMGNLPDHRHPELGEIEPRFWRELIWDARRRTVRVGVSGTPFQAKEACKAAGARRWLPSGKMWCADVGKGTDQHSELVEKLRGVVAHYRSGQVLEADVPFERRYDEDWQAVDWRPAS